MKLRSFAFAAALTLLASAARAECKLQKIVEMPVTMDGLRPHVAAKINGHDVTLLVDSGFFFSDLSDEAVARFGMKRSTAPYGLEIGGVGGHSRDARAAVAQDFSFAGAQFHNIEFLVGGRVGDAVAVGVVGENILGPFDVEYDLGNGMIRFFKAQGCGDANLAYWSAGMSLSRIPIDAPGKYIQQITAKAQVNGHTIRVTLDTGDPLSVLSLNAAARAGVQVSTAGVTSAGVSYGIYGKGQEAFLAPFASFKIGGEEIKNTRLRMADLALPDTDMLLGVDFFLSHRILVSNTQKKLYFTYSGGPVFRLDQARSQQAQAAPTPGVAIPTAAAGAPAETAAPKTAAEFQRRGQAYAARREFPAAIADFSKAIELEPNEAAHYHARALARLAARQPVLAMADLDQALKFNPGDVQALMARGQLYLGTKYPARAKADFEAAMKLSPDNAGLQAQVGLAYASAGLFDPALLALDGWVAAHPRDGSLPQVLNARCWTRAMANRELDKALADCDTAMRGDKVSTVMQNRGLVLLRMGRLDEAIAQYTAAIRAQPRAAQALYGRGLAELKKGAKAQGEADIAAAGAIAPGLQAEYKRFGLAPEGETAASTGAP